MATCRENGFCVDWNVSTLTNIPKSNTTVVTFNVVWSPKEPFAEVRKTIVELTYWICLCFRIRVHCSWFPGVENIPVKSQLVYVDSVPTAHSVSGKRHKVAENTRERHTLA